jgi:hypothetical protein
LDVPAVPLFWLGLEASTKEVEAPAMDCLRKPETSSVAERWRVVSGLGAGSLVLDLRRLRRSAERREVEGSLAGVFTAELSGL